MPNRGSGDRGRPPYAEEDRAWTPEHEPRWSRLPGRQMQGLGREYPTGHDEWGESERNFRHRGMATAGGYQGFGPTGRPTWGGGYADEGGPGGRGMLGTEGAHGPSGWEAEREGRERGPEGEWVPRYGRRGPSRGWGERRPGREETPRRGRGRPPRAYVRSDDRIRDDIYDRLSDQDWIDADGVEVKVEKGVVTLSGTVPERNDKRMCEDVAEAVLGVVDVINEIRVVRGGGTSPGLGTPAPTAPPGRPRPSP